MSNIDISILMPARNAEKYIAECIDSVIHQSYLNWELIVVDDGSKDTTCKILEQYQKYESRIHLFKQEELGIIPALRHAYNKSKGKLITRMDADDIMPQYKIEKLAALLLKSGPGHIATGLVEYFSATGLGDGYIKYQNWLNRLTQTRANYFEIYKECCIASPCWMVWREDLDACEAFEPETYPEDYDLVFRFYRQGLQVVAANDILHRWRDYDSRASRTHEHYKDNAFVELKVKYFLDIDYESQKKLVLWGAGKRGKRVAKVLKEKNIDFTWVCNNPDKIGQEIYQTMMRDSSDYNFSNTQVIITVANSVEQMEILSKIDQMARCVAYCFC
ncbi:MAG: glycosyltransferase family 2 protein [Leptospirales bacterium]